MTGSLSAKIDVIKMGISERNITIIPHGVITIDHKFKKLKKEKNKVIIFLGVLSKDKGIEDAVKCFNILSKKSSELNFWIIGRPETQEFGNKISQLVGSLKLTKKVKFWGYISDQKKFELLSNGFCLINPSVHEGWGLVNIEANSVGLPVIAYKVPGSIDSINQDISGLLCNKNTPEGLAEKVLELLENPSKYQKLQKGALRWSSKFSWKKSKALSLKLLKSI